MKACGWRTAIHHNFHNYVFHCASVRHFVDRFTLLCLLHSALHRRACRRRTLKLLCLRRCFLLLLFFHRCDVPPTDVPA